MKKDIHPDYNDQVTITCACGADYKTGSTEKEIHVELCSNCHPFYTGTMKIVDSARRVEKFQARAAQKAGDVLSKADKKAAKRAKKADKKPKYEIEEAKGATVKKRVAEK